MTKEPGFAKALPAEGGAWSKRTSGCVCKRG